ncbi:hypothetical protein [Neobacillus cucumis]|uniref:hypothetical protein n=1 Tax=Neobacillus cucumis TaxID=1740721 RepID=UPI002E2236FF|nr:hypothetical protein [Neobacillus cucumis]
MDVTHDEEKIYIKDGKETLAYTNYDPKLYEIIKNERWYRKSNYLYCNRLVRYFHQVVMAFWYGEEAFNHSLENGFIVEHHNNDGANCTIRNMSFAHKDHNLMKAHSFDKMKIDALPLFGISFVKDFKTQQYQIVVGVNHPSEVNDNGEWVPVAALYFLYDDDFFRTISDANIYIHEMQKNREVDIKKLHFKDISYKPALLIEKTPALEGASFIQVNDQFVFLQGNDRAFLCEIAPDERLFNEGYDIEDTEVIDPE